MRCKERLCNFNNITRGKERVYAPNSCRKLRVALYTYIYYTTYIYIIIYTTAAWVKMTFTTKRELHTTCVGSRWVYYALWNVLYSCLGKDDYNQICPQT